MNKNGHNKQMTKLKGTNLISVNRGEINQAHKHLF